MHIPINKQAIQQKAYELWQARGCPEGTAEEDWYTAEQCLRQALVPDLPAVPVQESAPAKPAKKYGLRKI